MNRTPHTTPSAARPRLPHRHPAMIVVAAALSVLTSAGLLGATVALFQQDGAPPEPIVVAERACSAYRWLASERDACVATYLAASRPRIASR